MTSTPTQTASLVSENISDLAEAAKQLLALYPEVKVFTFSGTLGAGKTTFIKAICRHLGINDPVSSPTFSIINEYRDDEGKPVYHFDFYRLKTTDEAANTGCADYFFSGNYCFIEWPDIAEPLLPGEYVKVDITTEDEKRIINTTLINS